MRRFPPRERSIATRQFQGAICSYSLVPIFRQMPGLRFQIECTPRQRQPIPLLERVSIFASLDDEALFACGTRTRRTEARKKS